jgi:hypothetical protein
VTGHLFNGYETRHLKLRLRAQAQLPDQAAAEPVGAY